MVSVTPRGEPTTELVVAKAKFDMSLGQPTAASGAGQGAVHTLVRQAQTGARFPPDTSWARQEG